MKTIIHCMLTLKAIRALKKKIDTKKAISGLFTAVTLFTVLAGNSSFITAGIGQTLEKTKLAMIEMLPIGEEITAVKISTPSLSMIRKADREIHLNMNAMIKELNSFHIETNEPNSADQEINDQFKHSYMINTEWERFENDDIRLTEQFEAENININLDNTILKSDNLIFKQFYLSDYSIPNPILITYADVLMTNTFCTENK